MRWLPSTCLPAQISSPGLGSNTRNGTSASSICRPSRRKRSMYCASRALFDYWLKKHYFYQPEVLFSRRLLEQVGGTLREDLHYTMDYDFWLRCAAVGGTVSVAHFPVAFFRKHSDQKTIDIDATVIEQANVRNSYTVPQPSFDRALDVRDRLRRRALSTDDADRDCQCKGIEDLRLRHQPRTRGDFPARRLGGLVSRTHSISAGRPRSDLVLLPMHLLEYEVLREILECGLQRAYRRLDVGQPPSCTRELPLSPPTWTC